MSMNLWPGMWQRMWQKITEITDSFERQKAGFELKIKTEKSPRKYCWVVQKSVVFVFLFFFLSSTKKRWTASLLRSFATKKICKRTKNKRKHAWRVISQLNISLPSLLPLSVSFQEVTTFFSDDAVHWTTNNNINTPSHSLSPSFCQSFDEFTLIFLHSSFYHFSVLILTLSGILSLSL